MSTYEIQLLLTSDVHGFVYPTLYGEDQNVPLGLAKLATRIAEKRAERPTLLIDNGDLIQGSPLTYYHATFHSEKPSPMIELANMLHYDAAVLGNHEFNYGMDYLTKAMDAANFPYLTASIVDEKNEPLRTPYIVQEIGNVRVAILGLTTQYIPVWENPDHIEGLTFRSALETAKEWVPYIRQHENIDCLVVAYHGGFETDLETGEVLETTGENEGYALATEVPGIDVLLTGHQHRQLAQRIGNVSIVQPGSKGQMLGQVIVQVTKDDAGEVTGIQHFPTLVPIEETTTPNADLLARLAPLDEKLQTWLDQPLGTIDGNLQYQDAFEARLQKHPYVEWINAVQMEATNTNISCTSIFQNGPGGLPSEVTMRDIITNYIFPNTLVVLQLTGRDIREAIEQSASYFTLNEAGEPTVSEAFLYPKEEPYNYDMWDGVEFVADLRKPVGERVTTLTHQGVPIKDDALYDVVMNNYRATGAGHFDMFKEAKRLADPQVDMTEVLADYFLRHPNVTPTFTKNYTFLY